LRFRGEEVTALVRIVRACAECGTELKEATLEMTGYPPEGASEHINEHGDHELEIIEGGCDQIEEGGGRNTKSYFGAEVQCEARCTHKRCKDHDDRAWEGTISGIVAASEIDEMV
jgi:hypothetical protein